MPEMNVAFKPPQKYSGSVSTPSHSWPDMEQSLHLGTEENPMNPIMRMHQICSNYFVGKSDSPEQKQTSRGQTCLFGEEIQHVVCR